MNSKEIQTQLNKIIESVEFTKSPTMANFLIYVVNETLAERGDLLKEYSIAVEALGKNTDFDPQKSSSVRTLAGRVRKALEHYYTKIDLNGPVIINLPKGQYIPKIAPRGFAQLDVSKPSVQNAPPPWMARIMVAPISFEDDSLGAVADGIGERMTIALAAFDDLDVVSHHIAKTFSKRGGEIVDANRDLGAEFVCTGNLYLNNDRIISSISLVIFPQGRQIWNSEFKEDNTTEGILALEKKVAAISAGCIGGFFGVVARERSMPAPKTDVEAAICAGLGAFVYAYSQLPTKEMIDDLLEKLDAALEIAPGIGSLHAITSGTYLAAATMGFYPQDSSLQEAKKHISIALLDQSISQCTRFMEGFYHAVCGNLDLATKAYENCLKMNPNDIYMIRMCGHGLYVLGHYERGLKLINERMDSNPFFLKYNYIPQVMEFLRAKNYEKAFEAAENLYIPGLLWSSIARCTTLYYLNRTREAQNEYALLLNSCPDFSQHLDFYINSITPTEELQKIFKVALLSIRGDQFQDK